MKFNHPEPQEHCELGEVTQKECLRCERDVNDCEYYRDHVVVGHDCDGPHPYPKEGATVDHQEELNLVMTYASCPVCKRQIRESELVESKLFRYMEEILEALEVNYRVYRESLDEFSREHPDKVKTIESLRERVTSARAQHNVIHNLRRDILKDAIE